MAEGLGDEHVTNRPDDWEPPATAEVCMAIVYAFLIGLFIGFLIWGINE